MALSGHRACVAILSKRAASRGACSSCSTPSATTAPGDRSALDEGTDTYDTIEWLLKNVPNHNGRVGMLGVSYDSQLMGHDIAETAPEDDRAFISTYQLLGYLRGDRLTILSPDRKAQSYHIDDWGKSIYTPLPDDAAADAAAISWYQGASMLYHRTL